ncbi:hypothetical protein IGI04_014704 [Brassica rapa subsp. trilocularis]|uniref:Uncharacterized protein n=1 Tax=Brassica rapa subsp. trilocularis TaxID=1813537 RepID=A0ABQ7MMX6_BRACM|nr:hypothetical protein IGI04_014704 [Brassica rapa subsp. trilocularis]
MIPIDKPFEDAYYTHKLWMFFRETKEKEEYIRRIFCEARIKMRKRITLKKKSDNGQFVIPCTVKDPYTQYDPIPVKKSQTLSRRINDPGVIAACHCGLEYETDYSASIKTHTATSIDSCHQISTDRRHEESSDSSSDDWENDYYNSALAAYTRQNFPTEEYDEDYEEERATEYKAIINEENKFLHHSSWKRNVPSIDATSSPSIDTQPPQRNGKRAWTDIPDYPSIDTDLIGSWADDHHHESYAVETVVYAEDELHEGFTDEELLSRQIRNETDQHLTEITWGTTRTSHPIDSAIRPSIDTHHQQSINNNNTTSIDNRPIPKTTDPDGHTKAINGRTLHLSREDIAHILQTANGTENLFLHHRNNPEHKVTKDFYDTADSIDNSFIHKSCHPSRPSIGATILVLVDRHHEFGRRAYYLYGNRKDEQGCARGMDGRIINISKENIRRLLERASKDEPSYICLPEHATFFLTDQAVTRDLHQGRDQ